MAKLVFSKHAVEQMTRRHISAEEVELLVSHPDGRFFQSRDKQVVYRRFAKREDNLIAAVVVLEKLDILEVITVMHYFEVRK